MLILPEPLTMLLRIMAGTLYVVSLPIGNLEDVTIRAIRTLRSVDGILAEDTRTTQRLLDRYGIGTVFFSSVFQGGERQRCDWLIEQLHAGKDLALVSDAGTPLISDPGYPLVRAAVAAAVPVVPVPGPSALLAALVASGLPVDRFGFEGSVPRKTGERRALIERLRDESRTIVLCEAPHRLLATLEDLAALLPDRRVVLARELTKLHEEILRGHPGDLLDELASRDRVRGECVLVLAGCPTSPEPDRARIEATLAALQEAGVSSRASVAVLTAAFDLARNAAYGLVHSERETND